MKLYCFYTLKALWDGQGKIEMYYGMPRVKRQLSGKKVYFSTGFGYGQWIWHNICFITVYMHSVFIQWNCLIFTEVKISSSHQRCFIKKPAVLFKKRLAQIFSCKFCDYFKSTFFTKHLRATSSLKTRSRYITGDNSKYPISRFNVAFYFLACWPQKLFVFSSTFYVFVKTAIQISKEFLSKTSLYGRLILLI